MRPSNWDCGQRLLLVFLVAIAVFSSRRLFRLAEGGFWSLNALAVQPCYAAAREALRQLLEWRFAPDSARLPGLRAASAVISGLLICAIALLAAFMAWPATRFVGDVAICMTRGGWRMRRWPTASFWSALMSPWPRWSGRSPTRRWTSRTISTISTPGSQSEPLWRIAHLSDIHAVGERYGFRIESGRMGPGGNGRLRQAFARLETLHAENPLHAILITGDVTDAGLSSEWAEFFDIVAEHPALADLILMVPGNHDLNIVDPTNPARLDLPTSPNKGLRKVRVLSAMAALQGERVRVVDQKNAAIGGQPGGGAWRRFAARSLHSPTRARHASRRTCRIYGPGSFRWCAFPTATTGSE